MQGCSKNPHTTSGCSRPRRVPTPHPSLPTIPAQPTPAHPSQRRHQALPVAVPASKGYNVPSTFPPPSPLPYIPLEDGMVQQIGSDTPFYQELNAMDTSQDMLGRLKVPARGVFYAGRIEQRVRPVSQDPLVEGDFEIPDALTGRITSLCSDARSYPGRKPLPDDDRLSGGRYEVVAFQPDVFRVQKANRWGAVPK